MNLCRSCRRDFSSVSAFDRHWTGVHAYTYSDGLKLEPPRDDGRRCLDEDEMRSAGMELDPRGRWCIVADVERARRTFVRALSSPRRGATNAAAEPLKAEG